MAAGSDTTASALGSLFYCLVAYPDVQDELRAEVDKFYPSGTDATNSVHHGDMPYLTAVINEALRLHATSGIGLPRIVPAGGMTVCGRFFPEGAVLSVPTYTIHRDPEVWGKDPDTYRPERWFEQDKNAIQKTFNPFSYGPRYVSALAAFGNPFSRDLQELRRP